MQSNWSAHTRENNNIKYKYMYYIWYSRAYNRCLILKKPYYYSDFWNLWKTHQPKIYIGERDPRYANFWYAYGSVQSPCFVETTMCTMLQVYDGGSIQSPLLGRYCGPQIPAPISSTQNMMTVRFKTDGSTHNTGFMASYTSSDTGMFEAFYH